MILITKSISLEMNTDIGSCILALIDSDLDKINFIRTCKAIMSSNFIFNEKHNLLRMMKSSFYHLYSYVFVDGGFYINHYPSFSFPKNTKRIEFNDGFDQPINKFIPYGVTHLTFGLLFNEKIRGNIPSSVTHLNFGRHFTGSIYGSIPSSVTHLNFGYYFNSFIEDCVPSSVTHLTIGCGYNKNIKNNIPSVTHLVIVGIFDPSYKAEIFIHKNVPLTVNRVNIPQMNILFENIKGHFHLKKLKK